MKRSIFYAAQVKEHLTQIRETVAKHTEEITRLQLKSNGIEQYDRRLNILVHGIPEKDGEITNDLIVDMCDSIQVHIKPIDISASHRLGKKCIGKNRPIICRLLRYDMRKELFSNKKKLKKTENYKRVNIIQDYC
ncbi:unnamed protein product [Didymodactylos carnosus]|uniref:Uncharacterized protein n=1 Tax=Didymodactylos carnosus TaxID=1234261 RepID=A0A8S2P588_9BILA|nr:unnamed protein product [Didymodactylos carnosus]CAF4035448.1 unnamed protein product [Didymodactylos carnosus]